MPPGMKHPRKTVKDFAELEATDFPEPGSEEAPEPRGRTVALPPDQITFDEVKFEQFLDTIGSEGGKVRVEFKGVGDLGFGYVTSIPISDFTIEFLAAEFGGGEYRCIGIRDDGTRIKGFNFRIHASVKGRIGREGLIELQKNGGDMRALAQAAFSKPDDGRLLAIMKDSADKNEKFLMMMMQQQADRAAKSTELFVGLATVLAPVLMAAFAPKPQGDEHFKTLAAMASAKVNAPTTSLADTIAVLAQAKQLLSGDQPQEKEEEGMLDKILKYGGPIAGQLLGSLAARGGTAPEIQVGPPVMPGSQLPQQAPPTAAQAQVAGQLQMFMGMLVKAASKDADPTEYALMIENMASPQQLTELRQVLAMPTWFAVIFNGAPEVVPYQEWFGELRDLILNPQRQQEEFTPPSVEPIPVTSVPAGGIPVGPATAFGDV